MPWVRHERVAALSAEGEVIAMAAPTADRAPWWSRADELFSQLGEGVAVVALLAESEDGRQVAYRRQERPGDQNPPWFGRAAWAMWPDYGGAGLWDEDGMSVDAAPEDLERLDPDRRGELIRRVAAWQAQFERRVSHEKGGPPFEWAAFHSCGSALARALSDASGRLVVYESPYEEDRETRELWIDEDEEPAAREPQGRELGRALAALDEERALKLMSQGVPKGALMEPGLTVAHICAHLGFERALGKALQAWPEGLLARDQWGATPLDAAVFGARAGCVSALARAGARVEEKDADGLSALEKACAQLRKKDDGELATLEAIAQAAPDESLSAEELQRLCELAPGSSQERARAMLEKEALSRGPRLGSRSRAPGRSL